MTGTEGLPNIIYSNIIHACSNILAPVQFCQKMQPFSQKIVAVVNVFVLTCSFLWFVLEQQQQQTREEKSNLIQSPTETQKCTAKIIGTLNLVFGRTPLENMTEISSFL